MIKMKNFLVILIVFSFLFITACVDNGNIGNPADSPTPSPTAEKTPTPARTVQKGDTVKVDYTGTLEDGTVFDSSKGREPLEFVAGAGQMIKGFDAAVIGMKEGEEKEISLKPEEAYGAFNPDLIKSIPREQLPQDQEPQVGMILVVSTVEGAQIPAKITEVDENSIKVNLNLELAGKTLIFKIKIVEIVE